MLQSTKASNKTVNSQKSSVLIIPPKTTNPIPDINVFFNNNLVSINNYVKYLGITIEARLNPNLPKGVLKEPLLI